jgi:hypothetical protein
VVIDVAQIPHMCPPSKIANRESRNLDSSSIDLL